MRRLLTALLSVVAFSAAALETPLIVTAPFGDRMATINPTLGTITQYRVATGQKGELTRFGSGNFLSDLTKLENYVIGERGEGDIMVALRSGTNGVEPSPYVFIQDFLGKMAIPKEAAAAGIVPLARRAENSEKEFWSQPHPYDGVVRAALGSNYLLLAVPATRTVMLYDMTNELANVPLLAATNLGPYLYHPTTSNSEPTVDGLLKLMPPEIQAERADQLKKQMEAQLEQQNQTIELKPCDFWVCGTNLDEFLVADLANLRLISMQYRGKALYVQAIRNMEVDLMVPSAINSRPDLQELFNRLKNDRNAKPFLQAEGITDFLSFQVYVDSAQSSVGGGAAGAGGKSSTIQVTRRDNDVIFDFTDRRKLVSYQFGGDARLWMKSIRDYTVDAGIDLIAAEIQKRMDGAEFFAQAKLMKKPTLALRLLQSALRSDPYLLQALEKDKRLVKMVSETEGYAAVIEEAAAKVKALDAAREARMKAIEQRREEEKKR